MHPILAMGDIATPVLFYSLLFSDGILLATIGLLGFSLWKRSPLAVAAASILLSLICVLAFMWMSMAQGIFDNPLTEEFYKTPSLIFWCRVSSVVWFLEITTIVYFYVKLIRRKKNNERIDQHCRASDLYSLATPTNGLIIGILVTPIFLVLAVISSGAGHGNYLFARLFYPIPMIVMMQGAGWVALALAILQYPFFGWFISRCVSKKQISRLIALLGVLQIIPMILMLFHR